MRPGQPKVDAIDGFAALLERAGVDFGVEDIADAIWLAGHMGPLSERDRPQTDPSAAQPTQVDIREEIIEDDGETPEDQVSLSLPSQPAPGSGQSPTSGIPLKAPAAPALRIRLALARALRPLRRSVPSPARVEFDEAATVDQIADQRIWSPVLKPAPERWLEVALVVEATAALPLWEETITEFQTLLERQGAFRRVTTWRLQVPPGQSPQLFPKWQRSAQHQRPARLRQLYDPTGRRLVLLLSDCTSPAWHRGDLLSWLQICGQQAPTAVIQFLPQRLWAQTALSQGMPCELRALEPGTVSAKLLAQLPPLLQQLLVPLPQPRDRLRVPVVALAAEPLKQWARVVAGGGEAQTSGFQFDLSAIAAHSANETQTTDVPEPNAAERVQRFWTTASLLAQRLAGLMSAAPVSPPIVNLIRQTLLPQAEPVHVAEVMMGGLMVAIPGTEPQRFDFAPGVRTLLADAQPRSTTAKVLNAVSVYISDRLGLNVHSFEALLRLDLEGDADAAEMVIPFAEIAIPTLERMGGEYADMAAQLTTQPKVAPPPPPPQPNDLFPLLQTYPFREATLEFVAADEPDQGLEPFEFETVTLQVQQQDGQTQITQQRRTRSGRQFIEKLRLSLAQISPQVLERLGGEYAEQISETGLEADLEMVLIPAGTFVMGSDDDARERPPHQVTIAEPFLMSKYPITQAQWRAVATLPQIERELDPDPSRFKGDNRPVEQVSWEDAVEFYMRLSQFTGRDYRLPNEAEWEYACRAGTTTPFHFGETITAELANYRATSAFGNGPKGEYRQQTTEVGSFPANGFGLYDMHGNVWEWCQDLWHENYEGAPTDGRTWNEGGDTAKRPRRGGSWGNNPEYCRSAYRYGITPVNFNNYVGFRLMCGIAGT